MKKSYLLIVCLLLCFLLLIPANVTAASLSPALAVIANECEMIKCSVGSGDVSFTAEDFKNACGVDDFDAITITQLPPPGGGTLKYGDLTAAVNQRISHDALSKLRFEPSDSTSECSFKFTIDGAYSISCVIRLCEKVNLAPVISGDDAVSVSTIKDISCQGKLAGHDPDGSSVVYEIVNYPRKGLITLTDKQNGYFKYSPYERAVGADSFTYRVRDEYGSYSECAKVSVRIANNNTGVNFCDMNENGAHLAAINMVSDKIMSGETIDSKLYFNPQDKVSRLDFLIMTMDAFGAQNIPSVKSTGFADDGDIPALYKGYVYSAYKLGIVSGIETKDGLMFCPDKTISRSEAAVILNRIIGSDANTVSVFADNSSVPAWAADSLYAMTSLGVITSEDGMISPERELNRADTALMLFAVKNLI